MTQISTTSTLCVDVLDSGVLPTQATPYELQNFSRGDGSGNGRGNGSGYDSDYGRG